ncbi:MAG TPA: LuxR C-terminal-related transcriptional regulator [Solirubrobacteraceae bacterium]
MVDPVGQLERGRAAYAAEAWSDAYAWLSAADRAGRLEAEDLQRLATSVYMLGREAEYVEVLARAHRGHLDAGRPLAAVRCAFWIGVTLANRGEVGRAAGWLARARRLLDEHGADRVEWGYLLLPVVFEHEAAGDLEAAAAAAAEAAAIGRSAGDPDLFALAAHEQGHVLIRLGRADEGLRLLDETMVAVTAGELSPVVSGIVYCGVILACQDAHEVRRAQEWTAALSGWCERQPDLVAFTGRCLSHRAELMQLHGAWGEALEEARRAEERCAAGENPAAAGHACYLQGEIHRLLGDLGRAEQAYREASQRGREPQPGLALLRLAQGDLGAAQATIRRVVEETQELGKRADVLPAYVEIMLAAGDHDAARRAGDELASLAAGQGHGALGAIAAQARGAVELAAGDARAALAPLRRALEEWQRLEAPYEAARVRELAGLACRALGDEDAAALELDAARAAYERLGARPDLLRVRSLTTRASGDARGLTQRELEVLRLVATGATNKTIAARLVLSERTVDRHVSNILAKLRVPSRAAATRHAYEHGLL